ncbi:AcrR family transcriptional regulator [Arthrobacter sp. CAN_A6]|uniref:TetR/AcrR family transcriptional regulator n=1 Tax=Arthrobacter sp. CAN_A6 TaxID=2787721 RepID=UPI0018C9B48E
MTQPLNLRAASKKDRALRIQRAAETLLQNRSINEVTTKEVAEQAGIGEATLFRYIGSKYELLFMVYGNRMDELLSRIEQGDAMVAANPVPARESGLHHLNRVLDAYNIRCEFYLENPENAAIYLRAGFDRQNLSRGRNIAQGDRSIRLTSSILADGQALKVLTDKVDPGLVAQNCHAIYMHEIDRTPTRGLPPETIWNRVKARLHAQLDPLLISD